MSLYLDTASPNLALNIHTAYMHELFTRLRLHNRVPFRAPPVPDKILAHAQTIKCVNEYSTLLHCIQQYKSLFGLATSASSIYGAPMYHVSAHRHLECTQIPKLWHL